MRQNGISVVRTRKHKVTTGSNHKFNIAPDLLERNFTADQPNQKWAGDISYVWAKEGWLYLAVTLRRPLTDCIYHTDRGSQYRSGDYQKRRKQHGLLVSMSGEGIATIDGASVRWRAIILEK